MIGFDQISVISWKLVALDHGSQKTLVLDLPMISAMIW